MEPAPSPAAHAASTRRHPGVTRHALSRPAATASVPWPTSPLVPGAARSGRSRRTASGRPVRGTPGSTWLEADSDDVNGDDSPSARAKRANSAYLQCPACTSTRAVLRARELKGQPFAGAGEGPEQLGSP